MSLSIGKMSGGYPVIGDAIMGKISCKDSEFAIKTGTLLTLSMAPLETVFFWLAMALYAIVSMGYIYSFVFRNEGILKRLFLILTAGFLFHTSAIIARYFAQGTMPWAGDYENALMAGWFIVLFNLYIGWRHKSLQFISVGLVPLVLLLMGFGVMRNPVLSPKAASLKSFWLYIHVYFAWFAFGAFALAFGTGILYILKDRDSKKENKNIFYEKIPPLERLDELIFRFIVFGFITDAIMIASGSIWAKDLWGSYWSWDPVETWSLISWLMYGVIIHLRVTLGWRGKRIAWLAIFAILGMIITFFGVTFVVESSLHIFNVR